MYSFHASMAPHANVYETWHSRLNSIYIRSCGESHN